MLAFGLASTSCSLATRATAAGLTCRANARRAARRCRGTINALARPRGRRLEGMAAIWRRALDARAGVADVCMISRPILVSVLI